MQIPLIWCKQCWFSNWQLVVLWCLYFLRLTRGWEVWWEITRVSGTEWSVTSKEVFAVWKQDSTIFSSHILWSYISLFFYFCLDPSVIASTLLQGKSYFFTFLQGQSLLPVLVVVRLCFAFLPITWFLVEKYLLCWRWVHPFSWCVSPTLYSKVVYTLCQIIWLSWSGFLQF